MIARTMAKRHKDGKAPGTPSVPKGTVVNISYMYFAKKTMYFNRKFDIIDGNKWLINTYFLYALLYIKYSILYHK